VALTELTALTINKTHTHTHTHTLTTLSFFLVRKQKMEMEGENWDIKQNYDSFSEQKSVKLRVDQRHNSNK